MKTTRAGRWRWLETCLYLLAAILVYELLLWRVLTLAAEPSWANPMVMAVKRISPVTTAQTEPNFLNNLDCTLLTYRVPASSAMQTGCFTETAFGLFDSDNSTAIYTGTDEGLPLLGYSPNDILAPWPRAGSMLMLNAVNTGGSNIRLYKNPLEHTQDVRNLFLQLSAKQLVAPPDLTLKDKAGQNLVINPQTLAFSDNGAWLVAETLNSSFIRMNLATLDIKAFAPAFGATGSPALLQSRVAISEDGHYAAIMNNAAQSFKVYDLTSCSGNPVNLQPENCPAYDYFPYIKSHIDKLISIRHVRFVNEGLLSFEANTNSPDSAGIYELAPTESINSLIDYLGMGDSYTSGEGVFDYRSGTDTDTNHCHLSAKSYPMLLTKDLFSQRGGHSVACSGAVIHDLGTKAKDYSGQVDDGQTFEKLQSGSGLLDSVMANFIPGYVAQHNFVQQYQPAITTASIGGNDVGFADILEECVIPHISRHNSDNICFNTYEDRQEVVDLINRTVPRWTRLFNQIKSEAPVTRLYVIGYPSILSDQGSCGLNVHLGKSELEFAEELVTYINSGIVKAADHAGVVYVDISKALIGHRLCEAKGSTIAVNGLTAGNDAGIGSFKVLGLESYHPNALGHELIEQTILKQTHNLTSLPASPSPDPDSSKLLKAPKSGRKVTIRAPAPKSTKKVIKKGQTAKVKTKGSSTGIKPNTPVQVRLDGPNGPVVGSGNSDENGATDITITIPEGTPQVDHTVDTVGDNQAGEPVDAGQPIYTPVDGNDIDGDGLPNSNDSCPSAINSGADEDYDGVDDTCDGYIGPVENNLSGQEPTIQGIGITAKTTGPGLPLNPSRPKVVASLDLGKNLANKQAKTQLHHPVSGALSRKYHFKWSIWLPRLCLLWLLLLLVLILIEQYVEKRDDYAYA